MLTGLREALDQPWRPVSAAALWAWTAFYALFLLYALLNRSQALLVDNVNLVVHEAGHLLFGWFGETLGLLGGTLFQLLVPAALAAYFVFARQITATAFCGFFFFENFLPIATYMADARAQDLPLVTAGGGDVLEHDWYLIFSRLGLLPQDTTIAAVVRVLGWLGMIATVLWLVWRGRQRQET